MRRTIGSCLAVSAITCAAHSFALQVTIVSPAEGESVFNDVEFVVEVQSEEPVDRVELSVDGSLRAVLQQPPYRLVLDVGDANLEHVFTATVVGVSGSAETTVLVTPPIKIDLVVDLPLRQLYVTASRNGSPELELDRSDFSIFEDGVEQEIVTFEQGGVPMTIALLVDVSASMKGARLDAAFRAAKGLTDRMEPLDEVVVMVFSDRILHLSASWDDSETVQLPSVEVDGSGGTALNDHLYAATRLLDERHGRPVVILLSDGTDTVSFLSAWDVLWKIRRSNVTIYRIQAEDYPGGTGAFATAWQDLRSSRLELRTIEDVVTSTGGKVESFVSIDLLDRALDNVVREHRQQYVLGYYPPDPRHDGSWRSVEVSTDDPSVDLRTSAGYIDE